jgi:hypothetical protein
MMCVPLRVVDCFGIKQVDRCLILLGEEDYEISNGLEVWAAIRSMIRRIPDVSVSAAGLTATKAKRDCLHVVAGRRASGISRSRCGNSRRAGGDRWRSRGAHRVGLFRFTALMIYSSVAVKNLSSGNRRAFPSDHGMTTVSNSSRSCRS